MKLDRSRVTRIIKASLKEDLGKGDITTLAVIPKIRSARGTIIAREECVMCGIQIAEWVFGAIDMNVRFKPQVSDGDRVSKGQEVALFEGPARAILTGERLSLNYISFLSGISTEVRRYADIAGKYGVRILDTRKTLPLLRYLEKYAVTVGGGYNHRMDLGELVMVKDNHLELCGKQISVNDIRRKIGRPLRVEVEVDNLPDFERMLGQRPDIIMLDNMFPDEISKAVSLRNKAVPDKSIVLEASGGITLHNLETYARTGVDTISIGALTDSVRGIDFSLDIV